MDEEILDLDLNEFTSLFDDTLPSPHLFCYYGNIKERNFFINDEITDELLNQLSYWILYWNRKDKDIPEIDRKPIKIFINSVGGSLDVQAILCNLIELSKTPIIGIAMGMVASAASLIFMACHCKLIMPNAYLLVHQGSAALSGNYGDIAAAMEDYEKTVRQMEDFIIAHTDYTEEEVRDKIRKDWYIKADEAIKRGVADEIITDINAIL